MKKRPHIETLESRLLLSASQLAFIAQPTSANVGSTLNSISVAVENASGMVITGNSDNITLSLTNGPGSLNGSVTVKAVDGVATFSNLSISDDGTYALSAKDGSVLGLSDSFQIADQLTASDVSQIIRQARDVSLPTQTIVVVDRQGNVLGIYGQNPGISLDSISDTASLAEQASAVNPSSSAAIYALVNAVAEARTVAYFESSQNAFTTRTARFIVTPNFPQGVDNTEAGPLLGVEFSQALGDDAIPPSYQSGLAAGLSGNPGGIPLYINGQPVGGIGVFGSGNVIAPLQSLVPETPGTPAFESDPTGAYYNGVQEYSFDEAVAQAGAAGFMAPETIQAQNIFINGLALPFTAENAATGTPSASVVAADGLLTADMPARTRFAYGVFGKTAAAFTGGGSSADTSTPYPTTILQTTNGQPVAITLANNNPLAGGDGYNPDIAPVPDGSMVPSVNADGVTSFTPGDFGIVPGAAPLGQTNGPHLTKNDVLTILEEAITQALNTRAAIRVPADVPMEIYAAVTDAQGNILGVAATSDATNFSFDIAIQKAFTGAYFSSDTYAFSARAIGFISDSTLPPAIKNGVTGPLSGLQDVLALPQFQAEFTPLVPEDVNGTTEEVNNPLPNGITIFPGGAPLYKDGVMVGGVGISGDGVDQDDLVDFAATAGYRPPTSIEDDSLSSAQVTADLEQKVTQLGSMFSTQFSTQTIAADTADGLDDPDVPNLDDIMTTSSQTIIDRILERLSAVGMDSVNLPYQKFPRNPGV
ncbi:MAG TPA: heme-binding protein [Tepidisphaeraceae bacterium]|nr:heme-binding protein [Tepidisphaeraceae bacterium]